MYIPAGQTGQVEVYNPIFAPDSHGGGSGDDPCSGAYAPPGQPHNYNYHECDSMGGWIQSGAGKDVYYSAMSYTLLSVPNVFDDRTDVPISQMVVYPIDAKNWSASPPSWVDVRSDTTHSGGLPNLFHQWQPICGYTPTGSPSATETSTLVAGGQPAAGYSCDLTGASPGGSYYRLRIDTLAYQGGDPENGADQSSTAHKGLAVEVAGAESSPCTGCTIGALNTMAIYTPLVGGSSTQTNFDISLMSVPPEYRGQTIMVDIYDPGDISCTGTPCSNLLSITEPSGQVATLGTSPNYTGSLPSGDQNPGAVWLGPSRTLPENLITAADCDQGSQPGDQATIQTQCDASVSGDHDVPPNKTSRNVWNGT